ncbi:MAG TPA: hypothetical protein VGP08_13810 [Pyrinomonadaceae bacterium]|nr:hypothetical protein [Pyrinomonadaceae bacterium]
MTVITGNPEDGTLSIEGAPGIPQRTRVVLRDKALVYSTDAVLSEPFKHVYPKDPLEMRLRDGQIICKPSAGADTGEELTQTYVKHWAFKCLKKNTGRLKGKFHFQNHSSFEAGIAKVGEAAADAGL